MDPSTHPFFNYLESVVVIGFIRSAHRLHRGINRRILEGA
jgi:hypothetical protein